MLDIAPVSVYYKCNLGKGVKAYTNRKQNSRKSQIRLKSGIYIFHKKIRIFEVAKNRDMEHYRDKGDKL